MATKQTKSQPLAFVALVLAWLVPGLGHIYLKRYLRGIIIMVTLSATFWTGMAIGGTLTVDSVAERWWFLADMLTGVHGTAGWYMQKQAYDGALADPKVAKAINDPGRNAATPAGQAAIQAEVDAYFARRGIALVQPVDIVARAFAGVAGLLNFLCIFDATMLAIMGAAGEPRKEPEPLPEPEKA